MTAFLRAIEQLVEVLQDRRVVTDRVHAGHSGDRGRHGSGVGLRVLQLDLERGRDVAWQHRVDEDRVVGELLLELLEVRGLALVGDIDHLRELVQRPLNLGGLRVRSRAVLRALRAQRVVVAQVDRELNLALPQRPGVVDLLDEQQAGAEQGQADRDDHDEGDRHGEVPSEADPYLAEHELRTHVADPLLSSPDCPSASRLVCLPASRPGHRRRGSGRGRLCRTQAR